MFSLGIGLPSYNCYVGLCAFLFARTKKVKYYYIVSYYIVILITIRTNNNGTLG